MAEINFGQVLISFLILLVSLTVHEAAHAWSADRLGDDTARRLGRVSLNPAVHIDPIGTIVFPLVAMFTGVPLIGWAKPVPVNIRNLHGNWKQKYMLIAAAGPASNLVLATIAAVVFRAVTFGDLALEGGVGMTVRLLFLAVQLNVLLAIFNMIPVPPLDGGNVLAGLLRGNAAAAYDRIRPYGIVVIYALMLSGALWAIVGPIESSLIGFLL